MKINIEVEEQYLKDLIDKNFDKPRFKDFYRLDLLKEEIFDKLLKLENNIIIREGYGGFNSNAYFTVQIRSAFAGIVRRDFRSDE